MKQTHKTNIEFVKLKDEHGFSIASIAKFMFCSVDTVKSFVSSPETTRHRKVPLRQLELLKHLLKSKRKPINTGKSTT